MNPTDTIAKLRKLTVANKATVEEERRAAEKIGRLLMAHPEIVVGGVPVRNHTADALKQATGFSDIYAKQWAKMREELIRQAMKERYPGRPPEGWDAWIRARARVYE